MKPTLLLLSALLLPAGVVSAAESDSVGTDRVWPIRCEVKAAAGITLINPTSLNDHFAFLNNTWDTNIDKVSSMTRFMIGGNFWITDRAFVPVRAEYMNISREYSFTNYARPDSGSTVTPFTVNAKSHYSVYPISIGIGGKSPNSNVEFEVDVIYALAYVTDEGSMGARGNYSSTWDTRGYGFQLLLNPRFPVAEKIAVDLEIGYRYLYLTDFSDNRGGSLENLKLSLSGVILGAGLSVTM